MEYEKKNNKIIIKGKKDFDIVHILECGQIFSYVRTLDSYIVLSSNHKAEVIETSDGYIISCDDVNYFENFFDLKTDYTKIKKDLSKNTVIKQAIEFGHGIRILKQDIFETIISFIISANNNIKRIQGIIERLRNKLGTDMGEYHAFPTLEQMLKVDVDFFVKIGAGYRAPYLYKALRQLKEFDIEDSKTLDTETLRQKLMTFYGVGPKVCDCILLFGYSRQVFQVDVWVAKVYNEYFNKEQNRNKIRRNLMQTFGELSGYAQQYLFYYKREMK